MQDLNRTLLARFLEDLKMRQIEFKNDHTISTALAIAIRETEQQLREQKAHG
jgi:hypothetical protein